jgi:hypothetical protein
MCREDVALVVFMIGFVALIDIVFSCHSGGATKRSDDRISRFYRFVPHLFQKVRDSLQNDTKRLKSWRNLRWFLTPIILSILWFFLAQIIISANIPRGLYPFATYYQWLYQVDFIGFIKHLIGLKNLEMIIGFFLPFLFLPAVKPKWLLLSVLPFIQIILTPTGGGALIFKTHYATLFLPGIILATIFGLKKVREFAEKQKKSKNLSWYHLVLADKKLVLIILLTTLISANLFLGPLAGVMKTIKKMDHNFIIGQKQILNLIPKEASIAMSDEFLAYLSSRKKIFALRYLVLGKQQYALADYKIQALPDYLLLDGGDLITWQIQFPRLYWTKDYVSQVSGNLQNLIMNGRYGLLDRFDDLILFKKDYSSPAKIYRDLGHGCDCATEKGEMVEIVKMKKDDINQSQLKLDLQYKANEEIKDDLQLNFEIKDEQGEMVWQKFYPLTYGFFPTSKWSANQQVSEQQQFYVPAKFLGEGFSYGLSIVKLTGGLEVGDLREVKLVIDEMERISKIYDLRLTN